MRPPNQELRGANFFLHEFTEKTFRFRPFLAQTCGGALLGLGGRPERIENQPKTFETSKYQCKNN